MKIALNYYAQDDKWSCWAISLKMLLEHLGIKESKRKMIKKLDVKPNIWTENENIIWTIKSYGLDYIEKENTSIKELKNYIKSGYPALVNYFNPITKVGHYSIINWYDKENKVFYFLDTRNGQDYSLGFKDFKNIWHNSRWDINNWALISGRERIVLKELKTTERKYWNNLWKVTINWVKLKVFSNWDSNSAIYKYSFDKLWNTLWVQFQCVEFIRRYIYKKYEDNLWLKYNEGDAKDWYKNRKVMWLKKVSVEKAKIWDVITFHWGKWWHVALVSNICEKYIHMTSQNFFNDKRDLNFSISKEFIRKWKSIKDHNNNEFTFESFLRYKKDLD